MSKHLTPAQVVGIRYLTGTKQDVNLMSTTVNSFYRNGILWSDAKLSINGHHVANRVNDYYRVREFFKIDQLRPDEHYQNRYICIMIYPGDISQVDRANPGIHQFDGEKWTDGIDLEDEAKWVCELSEDVHKYRKTMKRQFIRIFTRNDPEAVQFIDDHVDAVSKVMSYTNKFWYGWI